MILVSVFSNILIQHDSSLANDKNRWQPETLNQAAKLIMDIMTRPPTFFRAPFSNPLTLSLLPMQVRPDTNCHRDCVGYTKCQVSRFQQRFKTWASRSSPTNAIHPTLTCFFCFSDPPAATERFTLYIIYSSIAFNPSLTAESFTELAGSRGGEGICCDPLLW